MSRKALAGAILLLAGAGCSPIVLDPVESGTTTTDSRPSTPNAVAMGYSDWAALPSPPSTPGGWYIPIYPYLEPVSPGSLAIFFSNRPQPCSQPMYWVTQDPSVSYPDFAPYWQLLLIVPPELNRPGLVDLRDCRLQFLQSEIGPPDDTFGYNMMGDCGNPWAQDEGDATLEIFEASGGAFPVRLHWMPSGNKSFEDEYSGIYDAVYCGDPPPPAPPTPGLVLRGDELPAQPDAPPPDPERLYLFLGDADHTCADPYTVMACTDSYRVMLSLPPELQKPGVISLTDPAIEASFVRSWAGPSICQKPENAEELQSGAFAGGSVEILSIDGDAISLRIYGSHTDAVNPIRHIDADGVYTATMCP